MYLELRRVISFLMVGICRSSWCCDRRSVDLSVLVSGTPLGPMTRFYFFHFIFPENCFALRFGAPSLTRGRVCNVYCNLSMVRVAEDSLLSHLRLLGSLSVASYDSQGLRWKYSNPPPHGERVFVSAVTFLLSRCLATIREYRYPNWWEQFMKYVIMMGLGVMIVSFF
jgi:hypothetical protein